MTVVVVTLTLSILSILNSADTISKHQINIVVSFDGFSYKYLSRNVTPTLANLVEKGTTVPFMMNVFPTKTFPNHFSIVTGKYTEEHGVIDNRLFDLSTNTSIHYHKDIFTFNESTEPIWTLNERAGNGRHSGVMMWPGGEFPYKGILPTFSQRYSRKMSFIKRVDTLVEWILHPITPANLVCVYVEQPDKTAHAYGSDSDHVTSKLALDDNIIKYLLYKLRKNNIFKYNIIIVSDHGMSTVKYENIIDLNKIIDENIYDFYGSSPVLQVYPKPGKHKEVLNTLKAVRDSHFRVFSKKDIPSRWHYKNTPRAPPILLLADLGYVFSDIYNVLSFFARGNNITYGPGSVFGVHGYDPEEDDMHPIFIACGPSFKRKHSVAVFNTVDLYSLFANALNLQITSDMHSGDFSHVQDVFAQPPANNVFDTLIANNRRSIGDNHAIIDYDHKDYPKNTKKFDINYNIIDSSKIFVNGFGTFVYVYSMYIILLTVLGLLLYYTT